MAISRATKSAWRSVEQLKVSGRPLISRASKFLSALRDDLGPYGLHGTPEVKLIQTDSYCLGRYHRSLLRGIYEVELQANRPLDEIRATLLHETLHFIDDIAGGRHRLGDTERKYRTDHWVFEERLADFKRRLGVKEAPTMSNKKTGTNAAEKASKGNGAAHDGAKKAYEERQAFLKEHGEAIKKTLVELKHRMAVEKKLGLPPALVGYTIHKLGLIKGVHDRNALKKVEADKAFETACADKRPRPKTDKEVKHD